MMAPWPPQLIFNTDGHWVINYQDRWAVEDIVKMIPVLADCGVDALTALVGIDDDLSWRGSRYAQLWGDNVADWNPDPMTSDIHGNKMDAGQTLHVHGRPVKAIDGKMPQNAHECLYGLFAKLIADGHDLLQVYIDGARQCDMSIYAGFRMNDAHICDEARGWYGRSPQKIERPDLLIGQAVPRGVHGAPWGFSWRWDYAQQGVRERFLGLCDETLTRYDIDGVELDFSRAPPYFRSGEVYTHIPVMTEFVRSARAVVARHGADKRLIVRVPVGLGENLEAGLDTETWLREGLADIVVLGSPGYCAHEIDIARAVACAGDSGVLVFAGFDGATYAVSPQEGYERHLSSVLRATALNGYCEGAAGIHLFNYDYPSHRAGPTASADFNDYDAHHLELISDLKDPEALARRHRCYYLPSPEYDPGRDLRVKLPRKLALTGRGAGEGHALELLVRDDVEGGKAEGRIAGVELRLRLVDWEGVAGRLRLQVNGTKVDFAPVRRVANSRGQEWLVFADAPVVAGVNRVLVLLEGDVTPEPWPSLEQCEILVLTNGH